MGKGGGGTPEETEYEKELARIATEKWEISKQTLQPLEDMMIADVSEGITARDREDVAAATGLAHQKQFAETAGQAAQQMQAAGVDPTSGKYQETLSDLSRAGGESRAAAGAEGEAGLQSSQVASELNLLRLGAGEATTAQQSMSDVASRAASKAEHEAALKREEREGLRQLAGTAIGAGASYYGSKPKMTDAELAKKHGIQYP